MKKNLLILGLSILLIALFVYNRQKKEQNQNQISALISEVKTWKDSSGVSHAKNAILETTKAKDFIKLSIQDSTIKKLQSTVEAYKSQLKKSGSVTLIESEISLDTVFKTDTITIDNIKYQKVVIDLDSWIIGNIFTGKDSTRINLRINNEYSTVIGTEKIGFFKRKSFVEVTNKNPYSSIKSVRTYQVAEPRTKHFSIGPSVGLGVNSDLSLSLQIGISVQYSLFKF